MVYIIIYTISTNNKPEFIMVDNKENLAEEINKLKRKGKDIDIKIYSANSIEYSFKYIEKEEVIKKQVPVLTIQGE